MSRGKLRNMDSVPPRTRFRQAIIMMSLIQAVVVQCAGAPLLLQQRLAEIGPYRGRGKGGKKRPRHATGIRAAQRAATKRRNVARNKSAHRR